MRLFLLLLLNNLLSAQDTIIVPLKSAPMSIENENFISSSPIINSTEYKIFNDNKDTSFFLIRRFHFQKEKQLVEEYKKKKQNIEYVHKYLERYMLDTSSFSDTQIHNYLDILRLDVPNRKTVLITDSNYNKDFTDDEQVILDLDFIEKAKMNQLPKITHSFEIEIGHNKFVQMDYTFTLIPRRINLTFKREIDNLLPLGYGTSNLKLGDFKMDSRKFQVYVCNQLISPIHYNNLIHVYFEENGQILNNGYYEIGDNIKIGSKLLKLDSIDVFGNKLYISEEKMGIEDFGINQNEKIELSSFETDRYLILHFWGTWCKPCISEMPDLEKIYNQLDTNKIDFKSISFNSDSTSISKLFSKLSIPWVNYRDEDLDESYIDYLRIYTYPSTYLISPEKKIIKIFSGPVEYKLFLKLLRDSRLLK